MTMLPSIAAEIEKLNEVPSTEPESGIWMHSNSLSIALSLFRSRTNEGVFVLAVFTAFCSTPANAEDPAPKELSLKAAPISGANWLNAVTRALRTAACAAALKVYVVGPPVQSAISNSIA